MFGAKKTKLTITLMLILSILPATSFPLVNATEDSWETKASMPTARSGLRVAVVDDKIYAIGGFNGGYLGINEMYDPATNTWTTKEPMPTARSDYGIAVYQNKIYAIAGKTGQTSRTRAIEVYNPLTDTWEFKTRIPILRDHLCANFVNGKIYLIGGCDSAFPPWPATEETCVYDPETDAWTKKTPIPIAVASYASTVVDEKIYIIGGRNLYYGAVYDLTQIYDPETDTWSNGAPIPTGVYDAAAGKTTGVFASKGIHFLLWDSHYVYDPETDVWTTGTSMLTPRYQPSVAVVDDRLYAIGGYDGEKDSNANEMYTPAGYIPEFPSWAPMVITLVAGILIGAFYKRMLRKWQSCGDEK